MTNISNINKPLMDAAVAKQNSTLQVKLVLTSEIGLLEPGYVHHCKTDVDSKI